MCSLFILGLLYVQSEGLQFDKRVDEMYAQMKSTEAYKYIVLEITQDGQVVVDRTVGKISTRWSWKEETVYNNMIRTLPTKNFQRYVLYQFNFENDLGNLIDEIAFITWYIIPHCNFKSVFFIH